MITAICDLSTTGAGVENILKNPIAISTKAKFQVDHFYPQSKHPHFSISLFNLYPVCASCNNVKSDKPVNFKLYTNRSTAKSTSPYEFRLLDGVVSEYLLEKRSELIEFQFIDPDTQKAISGSLQDTFDIQGIYETQKDVIEELIIKAQIYNKAYRKKLVDSFPDLFTHASLSNRIFVGNYTEPLEIHKRPLAKFTQDIARQLGLI